MEWFGVGPGSPGGGKRVQLLCQEGPGFAGATRTGRLAHHGTGILGSFHVGNLL